MRPSICNAFDPVDVEKAVPASKWEIDLKKRTLTDGHWKLVAGMHKGDSLCTATGRTPLAAACWTSET